MLNKFRAISIGIGLGLGLLGYYNYDEIKRKVNNYLYRNIKHKFMYDIIVIGGGSGGLACAKQSASFKNVKVAVLDFVKPSPAGTSWGIGGTCVNVGCIPKKLFHRAGILGNHFEDQEAFGWDIIKTKKKHNWSSLVSEVNNHIHDMNRGYEKQLKDKNIKYFNALGSFIDSHTISIKYENGKEDIITGNNIVIAVGGRPRSLNCKGQEYAITSDDIFWRKNNPGKIIIVGASYVALECAGFLLELGYDVTLLIRSIPLRGFDQDCSKRIIHHLKEKGLNVIRSVVVDEITKISKDKFKVSWIPSTTTEPQGIKGSGVFNTILGAIGRNADIQNIGLENIKIKIKNGKILTDKFDKCIDNIYCIGDSSYGTPELTPVAIQCGKLLANRLFGKSNTRMTYENIATTIFTPLEYGTVGLKEDDILIKKSTKNNSGKMKQYSDNIYETYVNYSMKKGYKVYRKEFTPLEWSLLNTNSSCYMKIIVDPKDNVIGMHYLGPNAGEIIQGFTVALKKGIKFIDIQNTIGIHPTSVERFCILNETNCGELIEFKPKPNFNFNFNFKPSDANTFKNKKGEACDT